MKRPLKLTVNGDLREVLAEPYYSLLDTLRDEMHLTGPRRAATRVTAGRVLCCSTESRSLPAWCWPTAPMTRSDYG